MLKTTINTTINNNFNYNTFFDEAIENSFRSEQQENWLKKYRILLFAILISSLAYFVSQLDINLSSYRDAQLDKIAITVDFGDYVSLNQVQKTRTREIDEVFGNQFVDDKEKIDPNELNKEYVDPRIATAVNPVIGGATRPIDLTPEVQPKYTLAARQAGVEGILIFEMIVSDDGKVLRAKPVGKTLGYGLERQAVTLFQKKQYKPSIDKDGKAITVKFFQPVEYRLQ